MALRSAVLAFPSACYSARSHESRLPSDSEAVPEADDALVGPAIHKAFEAVGPHRRALRTAGRVRESLVTAGALLSGIR